MEGLFQKLQELIESDPPRHEECLAVLNEILQKEPEDADALTCKLVCLINTRNFDDALKLVTTKPPLKDAVFERAYILYRLNRHAEALDVLEGTKEDTARISQLRGQVLYRLGRYTESAEVYKDLDDADTDPAELAANRTAALVAAGDPSMAEKVINTTAQMVELTSDMAYNRACAIIERGDWGAAMKALDEAEWLFLETAKIEELSAEEIEDGKIVFQVQRAYVHQRMGQTETALEGYESALKKKPTEAEVAAVASNNLFSLRGKESNLFDSAKKAKALNFDETVESKLTLPQRRVFALNRCLLALYMNKTKDCLAALSKLEKEFEGSELPVLVRAAVLSRDKQTEESTRLLQDHARANPKTATRVQLTLAQIQLGQGDRQGAVQTLQSIDGASGYMGVVGSIVKICEGMKGEGSGDEVVKALESAVKGAEKGGDKEIYRKLLMLCADMHTKNGDEAKAVAMLEKLVVGGNKDMSIVARLVRACSENDLDKAEKYVGLLPEIDSGDVDVQELEQFQTTVPQNRAEEALEVDGGAGGDAVAAAAEKKKKKRAPKKKEKATVVTEDGKTVVVEAVKLPKKYQELVEMGSWGKPDPERWLPWHQRSYNRKLLKKRKGLGTASGGAQGGAISSKDAALDRTEKFTAQLAAQAASGGAEEPKPPTPGGGGKSSAKKGRKKK
mmetsp:Transcript_4692/g.11857  ORF Transcript_4692/g.11857 Transcript_4692/m.11857 type:complete len:677 (+) Transcript_4692:172-2202(+)